ncbi:hypothetical protein DTO166G4_6190 [Paecilomyces variotii]|nr:hypothetical protein DTO166G4_6190 [Paecilomyces variotii]KAJ9229488.1 hypothetical protein DTO166G5_7841 [Paecilomyces variotii]
MKAFGIACLYYSLFSLAGLVGCTVLPGNPHNDRRVSPGLFESLDELARVVDISYCVGVTGTGIQKPFECLSRCDEFKGFELVTTWNTGPLISDSCGYIALSHQPHAKRIIVAFRGTYSITNTIIDLSAVPQAYVPYPGPDGNDDDGDDAGDRDKCSNCTVHAGFLTSWKTARTTVIPHVKDALAQYPDYKVVLVGHSLGGAVAALAGLEMQVRGWNPQVTTFGEPRIGNEALASFLDEKFNLTGPGSSSGGPKSRYISMNDMILRDGDEDIQFRRVTHINDPVPLLPLEEWGYKMHAGEIYISKMDLPPSVSDLQHCNGDHDPHCIVESELSSSTTPSVIDDLLPFLRRNPKSNISPIQQSPLSLIDAESNLDESSDKFRTKWSLLPARYRLWELFLSHRDYFYRLGLCVPGGDPSKFRGWEENEK